MDLLQIKRGLEKAGVEFEKGLSESEIKETESKHKFHFPPDLKELLKFLLPISKNWVNWRNDSEDEIKQRFNWVYKGIYFDIERNVFWLQDWGDKPTDLNEAFEIARLNIQKAPKLIPIFSHRYIPERPHLKGNPVFSVHQTDIIYGDNLEDYFNNEFHFFFGGGVAKLNKTARRIKFWTDLLDI